MSPILTLDLGDRSQWRKNIYFSTILLVNQIGIRALLAGTLCTSSLSASCCVDFERKAVRKGCVSVNTVVLPNVQLECVTLQTTRRRLA